MLFVGKIGAGCSRRDNGRQNDGMNAIVGERLLEALFVEKSDAAIAEQSLRRGLAWEVKVLNRTKLGSKLGE